MFPLKNRYVAGYSFGETTWYSNFHLGTDYRAASEPLYAPFDGNILLAQTGVQGGWTLWFRPDHDPNKIMRFMHLDDSFKIPVGHVTQGQQIAITDNSGWSKNSHLHLDIHEGDWITYADLKAHAGFINPETYDWDWVKPEGTNIPVQVEPFWVEVTVSHLRVRKAPSITGEEVPEKKLTLGDRVKCAATVKGDMVDGTDTWYLSYISQQQGTPRYFWAGGTKLL